MVNLKTLDTDFAAAMMARGARLEGWELSPEVTPPVRAQRKLYWSLTGIDQQWVDDYRLGRDGIAQFMQNRKMLINVCHTEIN